MNSSSLASKQVLVAAGLILASLLVGWVIARVPGGSDITLPDSPLYVVAVTESVRSLEGQKPDATPPQPCPDCGKIHARPDSSGANLAASAPLPTSNYVYCANCRIYHPVPHAAALENLGAPHPH